MYKKAVIILITIMMLFMFSLQAYATGDDIFSPLLMPTEQFMVNIFKPECEGSTFSSLLIVSGIAYEEDITVQLAVLNENTGLYEELYTVDGVNKWETEDAGLFYKEVTLKEGVNKIRIAAYKTSMASVLTIGENLQINDYTLTVLSEDVRKSFFMDIVDLLNKLN